ncbi:MAG: hypothetical protein ING37_05500 [Rhodocyclaceae bacterium]|nr:hypothetical protein [Rhodocyclaceae bacterium]
MADENPFAKYAQAEPNPFAKYASQSVLDDEPVKPASRGFVGGVGDALAGAVRGAGSIGATIVAPWDMAKDAIAGKGLSLESNRQRRADMDAALGNLGADTNSWAYAGGKLAGEIAGTAGAGGVLAKPLQALAATRYGSGIEPILSGAAQALQTGGFRVGDLAGTGLGTAARVAGGAATGAVSAGMVNPEDAGLGALIGGGMPVATQAIGKVGGAIGRAVSGAPVSDAVRQLAQKANELGIQVPADRIVNSKPMNALAATLNYVPFSGRAGTEAQMQSQLNRAVSRTFGQDSDNVTMALRKAKDELGSQFDNVLRNNTLKVDNTFIDDLVGHVQRASAELETGPAQIISKQVDEILSKVGKTGEIDGQTAYNIKKTLDRIGNQNSPTAWYANDLKKSLMEALNRSIGPEKAAAFATTRKQYGTMMDLQKLAQNGADGDISIGRLANLKNIGNRELQDLADISAQFLKTRENPHGAMQRLVLGGIGASTAGIGGLPYLAGGALLGRGANNALNSNFVRGLLMDGVPEIPIGGLLGQGAFRAAPVLTAQ